MCVGLFLKTQGENMFRIWIVVFYDQFSRRADGTFDLCSKEVEASDVYGALTQSMVSQGHIISVRLKALG